MSDRVGAAIVSATLQDIGIISKDNTFNVVDRNKIRKAREKQRKLSMAPLTYKNFGLHFDGRKDKTLKFEDSRSKNYSRRACNFG